MSVAEFIYTVLLKPPPLRRAANGVIRALLPQRVRLDAASVWLNPQDPVVSGALTFRVYERGEIRLYGSMRSAASSDKRLSRLATMASVRLIPQKPGSATTAKLGTLN